MAEKSILHQSTTYIFWSALEYALAAIAIGLSVVAMLQGVPHQTKAFISSGSLSVTSDPFAGWPYFKNPAYGKTLEEPDLRYK